MTCTAMAWLLVEGVLPAALSSNAHRKGGQKAPGWLLRGGDRAFALVPALPLPGKDKHGLSPYRGIDMGTGAMVRRDLESPVPAVTPC